MTLKQPDESAPRCFLQYRHHVAGLLVFAILGCAGMEQVAPQDSTFEITIDMVGASKDKIHDVAKIWIAENFKSARAVIDLDDKAAGILIGNGRIAYPCSGFECFGKGNWSIGFKMRLDARNERFRLQFSSLTLIIPPPNASERPIALRGDLDAARGSLLAFGPQIRAAILRERSDSF